MHTRVMMTNAILPDWPPEPGKPIGVDRARAYIAWIRDHVQPLVSYGHQCLHERYPDKPTYAVSANVAQLALRALDDGMDALNIGGVYAEPRSGSWAWMDIRIRRDGRLECTPGLRMRD